MSDLKKIKDEFFIKLKKKINLSEVNQIKSDLFGKNGLISSQFKKIGTISASERKQTSLVYDCTYQLGVSGDASGLNETTFTRDGVVTGGSGGFGTVLDFKPNQAGTGGVLILTNVFGTVNDGFTLEEAIGMSAGPRKAVINTVTKPQIYLKSGEILFSQSISPVARGPEKMEEYQLLIGF